MAGPNLEVFKFGLYLFFPIVLMLQSGSPEWYTRNVLPYRERIFPREEDTYKPPHARNDVRAELEKIKAQKLSRRRERDNLQQEYALDAEERRLV